MVNSSKSTGKGVGLVKNISFPFMNPSLNNKDSLRDLNTVDPNVSNCFHLAASSSSTAVTGNFTLENEIQHILEGDDFIQVVSKTCKKTKKLDDLGSRPIVKPLVKLQVARENKRDGLKPSIWLFCAENIISPSVVSNSDKQISIFTTVDNFPYWMTFVYAATTLYARRSLWVDFSLLSSSISGPWLALGDFNTIISAHENLGGVTPSKVSCTDFQNMFDNCNLIHMPASGSFYTWTNCTSSSFHIEMCHDSSLCNPGWLGAWPYSYCFTLARVVFDHNPIIFNGLHHTHSGSKPFKFHNMWLEHSSFKDVVYSSWLSTPSDHCPMRNLTCKLKVLKGCLKAWSHSVFVNVHTRVADFKNKLLDIQDHISMHGASLTLLAQ
ncbi:hypothetical protein Q3G72_035023 [Acer saccharum]|nr:hypothetical protein Q3G72_035023 [Acer saccharum]